MRKKILCIEDDLETAELIAEDLEERGYDVALAHDGQAGFSAVLKLQPDLVLCDVSMPVISAFRIVTAPTCSSATSVAPCGRCRRQRGRTTPCRHGRRALRCACLPRVRLNREFADPGMMNE